jgi:hypothetical protein
VVVTGVDTFRFYAIESNELQEQHTQLNNKDREITTKYSCHCWTIGGTLILCTEVGEIVVVDNDGSYLNFVPESPINSPADENLKIEAVCCY